MAGSRVEEDDPVRHLTEANVTGLLAGHAYAVRLSCIFAVMTTVLVASPADARRIFTWLGVLLAINAGRLLMLRYPPRVRLFDARRCRIFLCVGAGVSGGMWAMVPFLIPIASGQGAMLMFTMCAMISGAAIQGAAYAPVVLAFVVPQLLAIAVKVVVFGELPLLFLVSLFVYAAFIVRGAYKSETRFATSARMRADAEAAAHRLAFVAGHDGLTGLTNRAAFMSRLEDWLDRSRTSGFAFSLYLLDLDHFKVINDTQGHGAGDEVLCEVSRRLAANVGSNDVVARLGGDEFAILIADTGRGSPERADHLLAAISFAYSVATEPVSIGASLGIATAPYDGLDAKDLLVAADLALYAAKEAGRQCWRRFDETLRASMALRNDLQRDLPAALDSGAIEVWYQPQVALSGGHLIGLEALIRWRHPRHGQVSPVEIAAAALRLRVSRRLTAHVLGQACAMIATLERAGHPNVGVAVNLSPREFALYDVPMLVADTIRATGIPARRLEIEITEEALVDGEAGVRQVERLAKLGVRLAIDDFGTGCASIAYLRSLTVDRIKIDRSFVRDCASRRGDRVLVQAIIGLGRALGVEVLAEGVETVADALLLASLGCHLAQGHHFAAAMPAPALARWLAARPRIAGLDRDAVGSCVPVPELAQPAPREARAG